MKLIRTVKCIKFEKKFPDEYLSYGCGPGGSGDKFVPDTMWGLSMTPACAQHDHDYRHGLGSSDAHRKECDQRLRDNCKIIVNYYSKNKIAKALRHVRVNTYYCMVRAFGGKAYWSERN